MLDRYARLAPVPLRLALGAVFLLHGLPKLLQTPAYAELFARIGLPAPAFMALLIGAMEVTGGLLVLTGYWVRIAAGLLALVMLGAIVLVKGSRGFINGWEFDAVLLAAALSLGPSGTGRPTAGRCRRTGPPAAPATAPPGRPARTPRLSPSVPLPSPHYRYRRSSRRFRSHGMKKGGQISAGKAGCTTTEDGITAVLCICVR